jgi:hypothetical protein
MAENANIRSVTLQCGCVGNNWETKSSQGLTMDPESLYLQLGQLIAEMPQLKGTAPITPDINRWLGRAVQLVKATGESFDIAGITVASDGLANLNREHNAQQIEAIVFRALAYAEANAPASVRGGFIGVHASLDALRIVGKILEGVEQQTLIVDAYMDWKVFTDFGPTAPKGVTVRLLADSFYTKVEAVRPAMLRWREQFASERHVEVRLSAPRVLHDRLIFVDGNMVWSLTQSLKDIAARSPALVHRVDPELAKLKVDFYEQVWTSATEVT